MNAVEAGKIQLCMSPDLLSEISDVPSREEFLAKAPHFTPHRAAQFFAKIRSVSDWIESIPFAFTLPDHPKDDHLFNLAIAAGAHRLVTWERRLLVLAEPTSADGQRLRVLAPQLKIITPPALMNELKYEE